MTQSVPLPHVTGIGFRKFINTTRARFNTYPDRSILMKLLLVSAAVRLLFALTYPLNTGGLDAPAYVHLMLLPGKSNLLHSSASLYLLGWWSWLLPHRAFRFLAVLAFIPIAQHLIELVAIALFAVTTLKVFSRWAAIIATLLYATSPLVLSFSSTVHPQSLQASLFMISLCCSYSALREDDLNQKKWFYILASLALWWALLIRLSTVFLAPLIVVSFVLDKSKGRWQFVRVFLALMILTTAPYLIFHRVTTGTFALNYEKSWVLIAKLNTDEGNDAVKAANGINSKRFLALNAVLPADFKGVGAHTFASIDAVPQRVREKWRGEYGWLLTADDAELDRFLSQHSLPPNYELAYASTTISWYIGIPESDDLTTKVYLEWIAANPSRILRNLVRHTWAGLTQFQTGSLMPVWPVSSYGIERAKEAPSFGFARFSDLKPKTDNRFDTDDHDNIVLWIPGVQLFSLVNQLWPIAPLLSVFAALSIVGAGIDLFRWKNDVMRSWTVLIIASTILIYATLVSVVYFMRVQESRIMLPLVVVLAAQGVVATLRGIGTVTRRRLRVGDAKE